MGKQQTLILLVALCGIAVCAPLNKTENGPEVANSVTLEPKGNGHAHAWLSSVNFPFLLTCDKMMGMYDEFLCPKLNLSLAELEKCKTPEIQPEAVFKCEEPIDKFCKENFNFTFGDELNSSTNMQKCESECLLPVNEKGSKTVYKYIKPLCKLISLIHSSCGNTGTGNDKIPSKETDPATQVVAEGGVALPVPNNLERTKTSEPEISVDTKIVKNQEDSTPSHKIESANNTKDNKVEIASSNNQEAHTTTLKNKDTKTPPGDQSDIVPPITSTKKLPTTDGKPGKNDETKEGNNEALETDSKNELGKLDNDPDGQLKFEEDSSNREYDDAADPLVKGQDEYSGLDSTQKKIYTEQETIAAPKDWTSQNVKTRLHFADVEDTSSNFFAYFLFGMFLCILLYVVYHNKKKILALLLEGRRTSSSRSGSKRKHTAAYRKLDTNLEEAITSNAGARTTQIIY